MHPTFTSTLNQVKNLFSNFLGLRKKQGQLFLVHKNDSRVRSLWNLKKAFSIFLFLFICLLGESVFAQTPGLIIRKGNVTGGAPTATPLDPNGDGWVSATSSGFGGSDLGTNSEINYVAVPAPPNEPTGDLRRGATGYFSEIVDDVNGNGFYFNSDGVNLRFRMRIGGLVPGSKGYSALIDSDGKFGFTGPNADPNAVPGNPGFEYEVVYESNFRVAIYRIDGTASSTAPIAFYNLDTSPNHAQIAVAATADGGDPDYFYDWYVPISAFASEPVGIRITDSTPLRMTPTTVMAPKGAVGGPASDAYGDDTQFRNINDQWGFLIENQTPTTPDGTNTPMLICTTPTRLTSPIAPNPSATTSVSGLWTAPAGAPTTATVEVFRVRGGTTTSLGTVSVTSASTWTLSGLAIGTLQNNDLIYATTQSAGRGICGESNRVLVESCTPATTTVAPGLDAFTDRGAKGTNISGATIRIYRLNADGTRTLAAQGVRTGTTTWGWAGGATTTWPTGLVNASGPDPSGSSQPTDVPSGTYIVTQQVGTNCESIGVFSTCIVGTEGALTTTATPVVSQNTIAEDTQTLSGTAAAGSLVRLFVNGIQRGSTTATGGNYSFSLATLGLQSGNTISVRAQATGQCLSATASRTVVQGSSFCNLTTPTITTNDNGNIAVGSSITGFSSEAAGTTVTVYNNATDAVIGTTTVQADGSWTLGSTAMASTVYYARHTGTSCGTSEKSNTATTLAASTATCVTISPVAENATTVGGTGYTANATLILFIDGAQIGSYTSTTGGNWSIPVNTTGINRIYAGGILTTSIQATGQISLQCPISPNPPVIVDCVAPAIPTRSTIGVINTTSNSFSVTISNSISGVLYYIVDDQNALGQTIGTQRGVSQFGTGTAPTGGSLTLTSSSFMSTDGTYKFRVVANPLSGASCNSQSAQFDVVKTTSTAIDVILPDFGVTQISKQISGNVSSNDVLSGTISYSNNTGALAGATLTLNSDGTYDFVATAIGVYTYEINVCTDPDTPPACPTSFLTITVTDPTLSTNPPVANPDAYPVLQGQTLAGNVVNNDVDLTGTGLVVTELNGVRGDVGSGQADYGGSGGTLTLNSDGTFTLVNPTTPGTYTFTYTLCDQDSPQICALPVTVTIEVYPTGTANIVYANDDYANISKGSTATGNLLTNDTQLTGGAITDATTNTTTIAGVGTFEVDAEGDYTFTPVATFSGSHQFTYEALGASGASAIGTFHVTVEPFLVNPDINVAFKDETINGSAATNDIIPDGSTYSAALSSSPVGASITFSMNSNGTYNFNTDTPGIYVYNVEVCAPTSPNPPCETKTLTISVMDPTISTNPPVANNDNYSGLVGAGTNVSGNVLANDINLLTGTSSGLTVTELNGGAVGSAALAGGTLTMAGDGSFTIVNATNPGSYSFNYTISDGSETATATVFVTVYPVGAPNLVTAADDYFLTTALATSSGNLLVNDTQLDGTTPLFIPTAGVGTFALGGGSIEVAADGSFTFTPNPNFSGTTSYIYTTEGTDGAIANGTVYFTVYSAFIINPDVNVAFKNESINGSVATNDVIPVGTTYTFGSADGGNPSADVPSVNANGSYTFTPSEAGVYIFNIEACAPTTPPGCETKTLTITVVDPTVSVIAPVANNDLATTLENTAVTINVLANDQPGDPDTSLAPPTTINSAATNGTATVVGNNIQYSPDANYTGPDSFTYQICDGTPTCSIATVFITVYASGTSNVVLASDDYFAGNTTAAITGNVLTNDTQLSGGAITQVNNPVTDEAITGGELTLGADGSFSFTANPGFFGTTSYVYEAEGTDGATAQATLYITVGRGLVLTFNPACIGDVPYLQFSLQANFNPNGEDVIVTWSTGVASPGITDPNTIGLIPTVTQTISSTTWVLNSGVYEYSGQVLWPGAAESGGVPTNWPGWVDLGGGNWVYQEDGFSGYRTNPGVVISVNPDAVITSGDLGYPPPTPLCASSPSIAVSGTVWNDLNGSGQSDFTGIFTAGETGTNAGGLSVVIVGEDQVTLGQDIIYAIVSVASDGTYEIPEFVRGTDYTLVLTNDVSGLSVGDIVADVNTIAGLPSGVLQTSPLVRTGVDLLDGVAIENLDFGVRRLLNEWTGTINDDWCNPGNWNLGTIPVAGSDIRIPNTTTTNPPRFTGSCPVCINNLIIDEDAQLTIPAGVTVCVTGTLDSKGEVIDAGNIAMRGASPQTIIGDFNISNLEIDNPTGVTITAGAGNMVNITESLILTDGDLTTNDNLRLISDASGDAYIAPITNCAGVSIVGNVRVQKFVDGGNRAFRFIAHPFDGQISLQQIRDYVHITGEGLDFNDTGNPSAFWYVTAQGNQAEEDDDTGWDPVSSTNIGEWRKGRAVRMMFRGPRTQGGVVGDDNYNPSDVTYELIGPVNLCDQTLTGLRRVGTPGAGGSGNSAFNFIGNPFPAAIDLKTIPGGSRTNVGANYYVWQPRTGVQSGQTVFNTGSGRGGSYVTEPFVGGPAALGQLATGTGFFVVADVDLAEITFTEANKLAQKQLSSGAAVTFREDGDIASRYGANSLQLAIDVNGEQIDRVLVYFDEETNAKVDQMDATKFENPAVNFFTVSEDDYAMAIDRRPWVEEEEYRIPLHILSPAVNYTLTVPDFDLESGRVLQLHDRYLDKLITLEKGTTYEFEVTADQATKGHRFDIVMGVDVVTSIGKTADRFQAFLLPNPAQQQVMVSIQRPDEIADTHVRLLDVRGVRLYETTIKATDDSQISYEVGGLAKGVYLVEITHGKQRIVKRLMVN